MSTPPNRHPHHSKVPQFSLNQRQAQAPQPADTTGGSETRIQISTFFTKIGDPQIIYNGDRLWCKVTLTLLTAGPVAVGQLAQINPVTSGRGQVLQTNVPTVFNIAKGNTLYVACTSVNAINLVLEPYPWLETMTGLLTTLAGGGAALASRAVSAVANVIKPGSKI